MGAQRGRLRTWRMRALAAAAAMTTVAGLPAGGSGHPLARGRTAAPRPCSVSQLRLDKVGGQGFTSHREWDFAVRNVSSMACRVKGYPRVALLDAQAHRLAYTVTRRAGSTHSIVLGTWRRAYFSFVYVVSGPCLPRPPVLADALSVTPRGARGQLVWYAGRFDLCPGGPATITPMSAHSGP